MIYRIVFQGTGYDCNFGENQKIGGFFIAVIIEANDEDEAVQLAYEKLITSEQYMQSFPIEEHPNAKIEVSDIYGLSERDVGEAEISGFIFFPPEDDEVTDQIVRH